MKKIKKELPFDKRNQEDYLKITESIKSALDNIRGNPKIPATQDKLAKLAGCSRKTLHNREGVIKELKKIKLNRKFPKSAVVNNVVLFNKKENDKTKEELIKSYQCENALLFDKIQDLEETIKELSDLNRVLREDKEVLLTKNTEYRNELRKIKNRDNPHSNVVDIQK